MNEETLQDVTPVAQELVEVADENNNDTPANVETTEETKVETSEPVESKPARGVQKRLDELTALRYQADERARNAEEMVKKLIDAQTQRKVEAPADPVEQPPKLEQFDRYEDFLRAEAQFVARQEFKAMREFENKQREAVENQRREQETAHQRMAREREMAGKWDSIVRDAEKLIPDFYEVVSSCNHINETMAEVILDAGESGKDLAYYLGKNPEEAKRIFDLSPVRAGLEMARLESKLQKTKSKAPAPIDPIGGSKTTIDGPTEVDDMNTWVKKREAQLKRK